MDRYAFEIETTSAFSSITDYLGEFETPHEAREAAVAQAREYCELQNATLKYVFLYKLVAKYTVPISPDCWEVY